MHKLVALIMLAVAVPLAACQERLVVRGSDDQSVETQRDGHGDRDGERDRKHRDHHDAEEER